MMRLPPNPPTANGTSSPITFFTLSTSGSIPAAPLSRIYRQRFPGSFSVIVMLRSGTGGCLLSIADLFGFTKLAIQLEDSHLIIYYGNIGTDPSQHAYHFPVSLADGRWHHLAVGVSMDRLDVVVDCSLEHSKELDTSTEIHFGKGHVMTVGSAFDDVIEYPKFEVWYSSVCGPVLF